MARPPKEAAVEGGADPAPISSTKANPLKTPVTMAFLHQAITWPGVAGAEKTVHKIKGVKLFLVPQGLLMEAKGQKCIVPYANVVNAVLSEET